MQNFFSWNFKEESIQHDGKLISDLMAAVEKAEQAVSQQSTEDLSIPESSTQDQPCRQDNQPDQAGEPVNSESEQLA
jgi:hypothetical protein